MKPHITKHHGIWACRMCIQSPSKPLWYQPTKVFIQAPAHPQIGHGYTVREAFEDWKAQMQAQRA